MKKEKLRFKDCTTSLFFRVWENEEGHTDQYTLVIQRGHGKKHFYGLSFNAISPQGLCQYLGSASEKFTEGSHLGKPIDINEVPDETMKAIHEICDNF
jgi:hypothetical protein